MERDRLTEEFKYFVDHHDEIYNAHPDTYVVLKDNKVLFTGDTFDEALDKALAAGLQVGTFLVQLCTPGDSGYTLKFPARVIFS
ncbi:MAG: hypothetical protein LUC22_00300 [Prevotella sp.]|nr:hypothetical protein [Prevotella sp.]